jgi:hypothetical protein
LGLLLYVKRIITIAALLVFGFSTSYAQPMKWKKLADGILLTARNDRGAPAEYGAIVAKDTMILAGWGNLHLSTDAGVTWTELSLPISPGDHINDIAMYDDHTFAVICLSGTYHSSDRGNTWIRIRSQSAASILFANSPTTLVVCGSNVIEHIEILGNIQTTVVGDYIIDLQYGADRAMYALGSRSQDNTMYRSTDDGLTWSLHFPSIASQGDCLSMICDKDDALRFVLVNEDWAFRIDNNADVFLSSDGGSTWRKTLSESLGSFAYLAGNSSQGCHDYFIGTISDGVLRSSDKGVTWATIGGPPIAIDSRLLYALDDSVIYAVDTFGSVWVTDAAKSSGSINELVADITTDTIGGDIIVPINFKSSVDINAEFTLHFDTSDLIYKGTFDSYNIDHTIWVDKGTARIRYNPSQDSVLYAQFLFFPTDSNCTKVTIDSIITANNSPGCASGRSLTATICGPEGCGIGTLSRFIRYGTAPEFSITPNPTRGTISLQSNIDINGAVIEIRNEVGAISYSTRSDVKKSDGLSLDVSSLPSGAYILLVKGHGAGVPLVIMK